jgi:hypothetical protein
LGMADAKAWIGRAGIPNHIVHKIMTDLDVERIK